MQPIILIVGPTAVGKTSLSIQLAQRFNGEIISGDSMQIYQHLDIGTAKVQPAEMQGIPHYLVDHQNVTQRFTVADFKQQAQQAIETIAQHRHLPFIVGGTGFYLQALLRDYQLGGQAAAGDFKLRDQWQAYLTVHGPEALWQQLAQQDPQAAQQIPVGDSRRVIRALEVLQTTGQLFSQQADQTNQQLRPLIIGLTTERQLLYQRINQRVDTMLDQGLLAEAKWLYQRQAQAPQASRGIGYKELFPYFAGEQDLATAVAKIKQNSRHYAKRQLTFFRNQFETHWFDLVQHPEQLTAIETTITAFLKEDDNDELAN